MGSSRISTAWIVRLLGLLGIGLGFALDRAVGGSPGLGPAQIALIGVSTLLAVGAARIPEKAREAILVLLPALALSAALAECFLWIFRSGERDEPYRAHATWLWEHIPGFSRWMVNPNGEAVLVRTNRDGQLGPEPAAARRVVVYGDSFVAAQEVAEPARFSAQLEQALERRVGEPIDVLNAGVRSYGPDQELLRIEADLRSRPPDLIVIALYAGNDFGDLIRNGLYRVDDQGRLTFQAMKLEPPFAASLAASSSGPALLRLWRKAVREWQPRADPGTQERPAARIEDSLRTARERFHTYQVGGSEFHFDNNRFNADVALEPDSASSRAAITLLGKVLAELAQATQHARVPVVSAGIPFVLDACPEHSFGRIDRERFPAYRPGALTDLLAEAARAAAIPHVDLYPLLANGDGCRWYFRADDHWNAAAQGAAAAAVADRILELDLLRG